jgi:NADPH:quinone reductase-like Zn-dependent oxidoreductase
MSQAVTIRSVPGKPGEVSKNTQWNITRQLIITTKVYYPLALTRRDIPVPGPNQLLIQLHAAALNHRELFIRRHLYPGVGFGVPLFTDACGTVREAGSETLERQWKGKRVILTP